MNYGFSTPLNKVTGVIISLLMSIKRIVLSFGLAYLIVGLIAVSVITISYSSNSTSAVDKFVLKGQDLDFQCQKGQSQPFPNLDFAGEYAYCAPLSDQFSIYYVPGRNAKDAYMAKQETFLRDFPDVSSLLRRGKYYLVIIGKPDSFQDYVSLQQLLRPTDLITFDPDGVARSVKAMAIPIDDQSSDPRIVWNEITGDPSCSIQKRCINLSFQPVGKVMTNDLCTNTLEVAWLTEDKETARIEKIVLSIAEPRSFSQNIYAKNFTERYVKVVAFSCQN